ncbi:hypothetical protein QQF64_031276 [Cirrhinus molitorella]|uniref:Uncharacterized protein n=1 Tax=Cirrhinus molitorella TaxID=172907 RepID=A0ABR3MWI2_9TELE
MQRTRRRTQNVISYKFAPLRRVSAGVPRNKLLLKAALADGVLLAQHGSNRFSGFGSGQERPDGRCLIDHRCDGRFTVSPARVTPQICAEIVITDDTQRNC